MKCKYCGQADVDGGLGQDGRFICIDCIALDDTANEDLVSMVPYQGETFIDYPESCYDVSRYKRKKEE